MSRIALAIAMRWYLSRLGRGLCGESATRFDFMIRKTGTNLFRTNSWMRRQGEPYCLQSGCDVQAVRRFFRKNSEYLVERFDYKDAGHQLFLQAFRQQIYHSEGISDGAADAPSLSTVRGASEPIGCRSGIILAT